MKKIIKGDFMATLTLRNVASIQDFFNYYNTNDGLRIISSITTATGTNYVQLRFYWTDGNDRQYAFGTNYGTSTCTFDTFITAIIQNIPNFIFLNLSYVNMLYYMLYVGLGNGNFYVISPRPFTSLLWTNTTVNTTADISIVYNTIANKVDPYEILFFRNLGYRDGSGLFRATISDDRSSNNPLVITQFVQGPAGPAGAQGPQGPAGDPGPAGATPDMSAVVEKLTLISDKLVSIDSNLMAVAGSASSPVDIVGVNV